MDVEEGQQNEKSKCVQDMKTDLQEELNVLTCLLIIAIKYY